MIRKTAFAIACFMLLVFCADGFSASAADGVNDIRAVANGIVGWEKQDNGAGADGFLLNEKYLELAGTTPGDWYQIGMSRLGIEDNYDGYLAVVKDRVEERYSEVGKLGAAKATEWHRISLSILACGGDPTSFGTDESGAPINLIADGIYNRGKATSLGRQGINGWIWGLITLDSMRYEVPDGAFYTRDDIIVEIISRQLEDGGFALSESAADPDITAMAIQALAPYYNSEKIYTYTKKSDGSENVSAVYGVIDGALDCLSKLQLDTGDFASWGTENVESTDQVAVALCCLGIDPLTDNRFIKNGNTLLDGIMRYRMSDGGFIHSFTYDADNPTSLPDSSNTMAGEQTLYTIAAIWRQANGMRTLYDFRAEQSEALKQRIATLEAEISSITPDTKREKLEKMLEEFYSLPENERSYVYSYRKLSAAAAEKGINIAEIADTTEVVQSPSDESGDEAILYFSNTDRETVDSLPKKLTTEHYVTVTALLDKLLRSEEFDGKDRYLEKLTAAKKEIASIQSEIDSLNADIREKLYPFDGITLRDRKTVNGIVARYNALSDYDKSKIERFDDVIKTAVKLDNLAGAIVIGAVLSVVAAVTVFFLVRRNLKRRRKKQREMEELAALYEDESD